MRALILTLLLTPLAAIASSNDIARAVQQLGAPEFKIREQATQLLWSAGPDAETALQKASESADPEIALRARQLLANIRNGIRPDTPAEIQEQLRRYHAANSNEEKSGVISALAGMGQKAYPAIAALAEAEPAMENRQEVFQSVFEPALAALAALDEGVSKVPAALAAARLLQAVLPEDITITLRVVPQLDRLSQKAEADELFERAFTFQQKAAARMPDDPNPKNDLAWMCALCRRRLDEAQKLGERAVELAPESAAYLDTLAEVYFQLGQRDRALELIKKAAALAPDNDYFRQQQARMDKGDSKTPPPEPAELPAAQRRILPGNIIINGGQLIIDQ